MFEYDVYILKNNKMIDFIKNFKLNIIKKFNDTIFNKKKQLIIIKINNVV